MLTGRFIGRISREPKAGEYLTACGLGCAAVLLRLVLGNVVAGLAPYEAMFPAIAVAGVFCGTGPAIVTATAGGLAVSAVCFGRALLAPPINASQLDILMFVPAAAVIIAATNALRRFAADAIAAEARLGEVFRQIPGAATILEAPSGRLVLRSSQSDAVIGRRPVQMRMADELASYGGRHPDGRPYAAGEYPIMRALKTGEIVSGERLRYHRPDASIADLEVHAGPVRDLDGTIVAAVGMAFDVTERVDAERRLIASETRHRALAERLRAAIEAGALGLWELDLATDLVHLDATFAGMLGLPPDTAQMPRVALRAILHPADQPRVTSVFAESLRSGESYGDEFRVIAPDGQTRWLVVRGALLGDLQKVVGVVSDVTDRRAREEALQAALDAREVLMREADHRIKNSLQLVVSLLNLQHARAAHADVRAALADAIARVDAIARSHQALQSSPDLRDIDIDRMLADLCQRAGALNPRVTVRSTTTVGRLLDAERAIPFGLIASELLTNALRHAFPGGGGGEIALAVSVQGEALEMVIADTGVGMPAHAPRAGLGSTIVGMLARQIRATVRENSQPGNGVVVTVTLPLATAATAAPRLRSAVSP